MIGDDRHDSIVIADDAMIDPTASVGPFCVLGVDGPGDYPPLRIGREANVRSHAVVYRGVLIGPGAHVGHGALVREGTRVGADASIGSHCVVEHSVNIGDRVRLHSRCFVPELSVLEDGAWLGPGVTVTNSRYPNRSDSKERLEGVHVERGAVVGAGAVLLPGIRVRAGATVGAGAVVVRDVPTGATVMGNPARVRR